MHVIRVEKQLSELAEEYRVSIGIRPENTESR